MVLNVNTQALQEHTERLAYMHRSALPNAIRNTLNKAAFDVKTNTMPKEFDRFVHRKPTFEKANSGVEMARGFDVDTMKATVGFKENSGTQEQAVQDMQQQDNGGSISGRAFIPLKQARTGNSYNRMVRAPNRIGAIKSKIVDSEDSEGNSKMERYTKAAIHAGKGGFVLGNVVNGKGNKMVMRVNKIIREGQKTIIAATPIYAVKAGRHVHVKATHFMQKASIMSANKMDAMYIAEAEKQINKFK